MTSSLKLFGLLVVLLLSFASCDDDDTTTPTVTVQNEATVAGETYSIGGAFSSTDFLGPLEPGKFILLLVTNPSVDDGDFTDADDGFFGFGIVNSTDVNAIANGTYTLATTEAEGDADGRFGFTFSIDSDVLNVNDDAPNAIVSGTLTIGGEGNARTFDLDGTTRAGQAVRVTYRGALTVLED